MVEWVNTANIFYSKTYMHPAKVHMQYAVNSHDNKIIIIFLKVSVHEVVQEYRYFYAASKVPLV